MAAIGFSGPSFSWNSIISCFEAYCQIFKYHGSRNYIIVVINYYFLDCDSI